MSPADVSLVLLALAGFTLVLVGAVCVGASWVIRQATGAMQQAMTAAAHQTAESGREALIQVAGAMCAAVAETFPKPAPPVESGPMQAQLNLFSDLDGTATPTGKVTSLADVPDPLDNIPDPRVAELVDALRAPAWEDRNVGITVPDSLVPAGADLAGESWEEALESTPAAGPENLRLNGQS